MPQRTTRRRIATVAYQANQVVNTVLQVSGKVRRLFLDFTATLNVTGAGGTVITRHPGTVIPSLQVVLNGEDVLKDGRWNDWRDRMYAFWKLPAEVQDTNAVNATQISSSIQIDFCTPFSRNPVDTVLDMDANQLLELRTQFGDENSVLAAGTKAWSVNPSIDVYAEVSRFDPPPIAFFKESYTETPSLGTAANAERTIDLVVGPRKNYHHNIIVAEDVVATSLRELVATTLNSIQVRQEGAGERSTPFGVYTGRGLQQEFDQLYNREGVQTGIYPILSGPQFEGLSTYNLVTAGLDQAQVVIDHAAFTTDGRIRLLNGTVEPIYRA